MSSNEELSFTPMGEFFLFREIPKGQTAGGIALPEKCSDGDPMKGEVLKVGPGFMTENGTRLPMDVKPGDIVYMAFAYAEARDIMLGGKPYKIARNRDLVGLAK